MSIEGVSGDAGRWGDRSSRAPTEIERKRAEAAKEAFDAALRYDASPTTSKIVPPVDAPTLDPAELDRLTTAQRHAVLNRTAAVPGTPEPTEPMSPRPLPPGELARRRALDAAAAYDRRSTQP